jgi:hypothetical protein
LGLIFISGDVHHGEISRYMIYGYTYLYICMYIYV